MQDDKFILIVDYRVGNVQSIAAALACLGYRSKFSAAVDDVDRAAAFVLPGVGAFPAGMSALKATGIIPRLERAIFEERKPVLGICLGMQLMAERSFEKGDTAGLGWIPGEVIPLDPSRSPRVPHVGWNRLKVVSDRPEYRRVTIESHFYFDHGFRFECDEEQVVATTEYGMTLTAAVAHGAHVTGTQFHPEKSQASGLRFLRDFFVGHGFPGPSIPSPCTPSV